MIKGIAKSTLNFILNLGKSSQPKEFVGLLRAKKEIIADVLFLSGTLSSHKSALIRLDQLPIGIRVVGSVHSHPSGSKLPSQLDLELFSKVGNYNLIVCYPYREEDWACYNPKGEIIELKVLEVEVKEEAKEEEELLKDLLEAGFLGPEDIANQQEGNH
jgi:proteasome lid subunit RPN8/RPN11